MISIHCLQTQRGAVASGKSACLVNRRSLVQIQAVPHFQIIIICLPCLFFNYVNFDQRLSAFVKMIHCLQTHVVLWLSGKIACVVIWFKSGQCLLFISNYVHHVSFSK